MKRRLIYAVVVLLAAAVPVVFFRLLDPERLELDDAARRSAPGQFARLTDGYTHYELAGPASGRVVVLAAGFSVPYYIWDPTATALAAAGYRVLRYDYYGRGYSDRPDTPFTQDFYVRQLTELLDTLHITDPIDLAGLSFGASVVTSFADRYPARVRSLVYFDAAFRSPSEAPPLGDRPLLWSISTALFEERLWAGQQSGDFLHPERFPDWADRYRAQVRYRGFRRARLSELMSNLGVDQDAELLRVGMHPRPVLVVWGKQDPTVPFELSALLMSKLLHARLVAVDESGHLPQLERPEVVNPALIEFLRQGR